MKYYSFIENKILHFLSWLIMINLNSYRCYAVCLIRSCSSKHLLLVKIPGGI